MAEINAGVRLSLKDQFSSGMRGAATSVQSFSQKAVAAADKVNSAFNSLGGKLASLGVSIGAAVTIKNIMDTDHRLARLGLTADASAAQVNHLKREIFEAAKDPNIKIDTSSIISALEVVMTKTGDLEYAEDNIRNIAVAIQATGESGEAMGSVFAEFQKFGYSAETITALMDDMVKQGDKGAFTFGEFAKAGSAIISAYSAIGTSASDLKNANAAMQIIMMGTKSADIAVTALSSTMNELQDPAKQQKLRELGIAVRDDVTGEFRDLNLIMFDLMEKAEEIGNTDFLGTIFGSTSMQAIRAYSNFGHLYESLTDLGDTSGAMMQKSATMANTFKSSLQGLQTSFNDFADQNLAAPLEKLTDLLNKLMEDPEKVERAFKGIAIGLGAIAAIRVTAGVTSLIANLKGLKSGNINLSGMDAGGAGIPVHVTNWGGAAGASGLPTMPRQSPTPSVGRTPNGRPAGTPLGKPAIPLKSLAIGGAAAGGITAAAIAIPEMVGELNQINNDDTLTGKRRGRARGGAIGGASGKIVGGVAGGAAGGALGGLAAGAISGAAIGSVVPGLGTAIGAAVGLACGAIGMYLGGKAGRAIGEEIGEAAAKEDIPEALQNEARRTNTRRNTSGTRRQQTVLDGNAVMDVNVNLKDDRSEVSVNMRNNNLPMQFNTGRAQEARGLAL